MCAAMLDHAQRCSITLVERRIRAGLTQRQLAKRAGVSNNTVWGAEHGRVPTPAVQIAIASVLAVDVLELWPLNGVAA